jgi:hypothetical protein
VLSRQLGRPVRDAVAVVARCDCSEPLVIQTAPRLSDGQPFPTLFYLTCPNAVAAVSTLESNGVMAEYESRLQTEEELKSAYIRAHEDYLKRRGSFGAVGEIEGVSAGGMPDRVKCLHALAAHALAVGEGINPIGDDIVRRIRPWCHLEEGAK